MSTLDALDEVTTNLQTGFYAGAGSGFRFLDAIQGRSQYGLPNANPQPITYSNPTAYVQTQGLPPISGGLSDGKSLLGLAALGVALYFLVK